jgi:hypothetical protein
MQSRRRSLAMLTGAAAVSAARPGIVQAADRTLEGSWSCTIDVLGLPAAFKGLVTFNADGNITESAWSSADPTNTGTGHGVWNRKADAQYAFTIKFLWFQSGVLAITGQANGTLTVSNQGDQINGPVVFESFDNNGAVLFASRGVLRGTRIVPAV